MKDFNIVELFYMNIEIFNEWKSSLIESLDPFPCQYKFFLEEKNLLEVVATLKNPSAPIHIFGIIDKKKDRIISSFMYNIYMENLSAEIAFLFLVPKVQKTYFAGKLLLNIANFIDLTFEKTGIEYASATIPVEKSVLSKLFLKQNWQKKATFQNYYRVIQKDGSYKRIDVIYFDKNYT